jgi:hypothetical protein
VIDYITAVEGDLDLHRTCAEVKQVWDSLRDELTLEGVTEVSFGATNPRKELAGMQWFVIPVFYLLPLDVLNHPNDGGRRMAVYKLSLIGGEPSNFGMERSWPFPPCTNGAGKGVPSLRETSCCYDTLGHAAHSGC